MTTGVADDDERRMVPRWRPSRQTRSLGEFAPVDRTTSDLSVLAPDSIDSFIADWSRNREFGYAADLVCAASVLPNSRSKSAVIEAAEFVLASVSSDDPISRIASAIISPPTDHTEATPYLGQDSDEALHSRVRLRRRALREYPINPLSWVDLARDYASLGQRKAADRAMRAALGLAPANRFVVRSATRLALHLGHGEEDGASSRQAAWERLRRNPALLSDPWLAAAEIAIAMVIGRPPRSAKRARALLASGNFSEYQLSELAGALGSLEIEAGALRAGKKYFARALIEPTDNTVAQAAWTSRHRHLTLVGESHLNRALTFEARAWEHYRLDEWHATALETLNWHDDEPFSRRPLHLGTFVATVPLGDFELGERIATIGLRANPEDNVLRNNLAFSLASRGKISTAWHEMRKIRFGTVHSDLQVAYVATWGLLHFRRGMIDDGRRFYEAAIEAALKKGAQEEAALATIYLAREEVVAKQPEAASAITRAQRAVDSTSKTYLTAALGQVEMIRSRQDSLIQQLTAPVQELAQESPINPLLSDLHH